MEKKIHNVIFIVSSFLMVFLPVKGFSASFFFESDQSMFGLSDRIFVDVYLDTEDSTVNTISGEILIETDSISITDIIDGNSSILFWVDKPKFDESTSSISFSGITPGGISGDHLFLFSIEASVVVSPGYASFITDNELVLSHDGEGTELPVSFIPKNIFVSEDPTFSNEMAIPVDTESPEDFTPQIVSNENLFNGDYVLVFSTQDKGSGIDYYLIKEGYLGRYVVAESPYVLDDQTLFKTFFVKAVDKVGNERIAIVNPQERLVDENFILISSILIVVVISSIVFYRRKKRI